MGSRPVKEASACVPLSVCSFVFVLFFVCLFHRSISRRAAALRHACVALCAAPQPSAGEAGGWPAARFSPSGVSADLCGLRRSPARRKGRGRKGLAQAGERGARGVRHALEPRRGASLHRPIKSSRGPGRATLSPRRGAEPRLRKRTSQGRGAQARPHAPLTPPLPRQGVPQACTEPPG